MGANILYSCLWTDGFIVLCSAGESLAFTLRAFVELMDHGIVSWDILEQKFIQIVSILNFSYSYTCVLFLSVYLTMFKKYINKSVSIFGGDIILFYILATSKVI